MNINVFAFLDSPQYLYYYERRFPKTLIN